MIYRKLPVIAAELPPEGEAKFESGNFSLRAKRDSDGAVVAEVEIQCASEGCTNMIPFGDTFCRSCA